MVLAMRYSLEVYVSAYKTTFRGVGLGLALALGLGLGLGLVFKVSRCHLSHGWLCALKEDTYPPPKDAVSG